MTRYIDADKLIDDLEHDIAIDQDHILYVGIDMREKELIQFDKDCKQNCIDMLSKEPTADVRENVKGEWIRRDSRYVGWISFDCSVCGETLELDRETSNDFKYCPFCGANMRPISALSENVEIVSNLKRGES